MHWALELSSSVSVYGMIECNGTTFQKPFLKTCILSQNLHNQTILIYMYKIYIFAQWCVFSCTWIPISAKITNSFVKTIFPTQGFLISTPPHKQGFVGSVVDQKPMASEDVVIKTKN